MKIKTKQSGFTLMEMVAVVAAVAILTLLSLPAARSLRKSFVNEGAAQGLINSALASARAMAAEKGCFVGVRFQTAYKFNGNASGLGSENTFFAHDVLNAEQYMIFIMHDRKKGNDLNYLFTAVEDSKPIKLPDNFGVMDMRISDDDDDETAGDEPVNSDGMIDEDKKLQDATTFSIIFSPSGKLVIQEVRCRNKKGEYKTGDDSLDEIFNKDKYVKAVDVNGEYVKNRAMFFQDDYALYMGLGQEYSRRKFVIYERDKFNPVYKNKTAYEDYLKDLWETKQIYVNPYTGQLIKNQ
ncbi:MAG TPA: prepilin-type N-terminal cleavage/methylation domain-containing protein [Sedimentisphaerales bacterium]|nr:prepilin-type N-terminal cleavage/methylation domain-containing protein [Sedimentisphaerales bacterium]